jgi:hypothetical protein
MHGKYNEFLTANENADLKIHPFLMLRKISSENSWIWVILRPFTIKKWKD